jgi:hypothetical protein
MAEFLSVALSLPTVLFTVLLGFFLLYALLTVLGAVDLDWLDGAFDFDANGTPDSFLAGVPVVVVAGVATVFAWLVSFVGMRFLPDTVLVKILVGLGSAFAGALIGSRVVRPLRPFFTVPDAPRRKAIVGKICTIRSLHVTDGAGTAEIGDIVAEVRCFRENDLTLGSKAIVFDYDEESGTYHVGPIDPTIAS